MGGTEFKKVEPNEHDADALVELLKVLSSEGYVSHAITPHSHAIVNARPINAMAKDSVGALGWSRPFEQNVLSDALFQSLQKANVIEQSAQGWKSQIRVSSYNQLQFLHSSFPTNQHDSVFFGPDTYRFVRAIENHLARRDNSNIKRAVDICSGSGIAAIVLGLELQDSEVIGVDINEKALEFSRINATAANAGNVTFAKSDLLKNVAGQFDLIVANPPYLIDKLEREYRHGGGEFGEQLSLDIVDAALERLAPNGTLLLYTGSAIVDGVDSFKQKLASKLAGLNQTFDYQELDPDVFGEELLNPVYSVCDRIAAVLVTLKVADK